MKILPLFALLASFVSAPLLAGDCGSMKDHPNMSEYDKGKHGHMDSTKADAESENIFEGIHALPPGHPPVNEIETKQRSNQTMTLIKT